MKCQVCHGKGWSTFDYDGKPTIQRCDACMKFNSDVAAAKEAKKTGINVRLRYPCFIQRPYFK